MTAGNETTRNTINGAIIALAENPDQMKALAAQPALVKLATEEFLRWVSPVRGFGRTVIREVELNGRKLEPGQRLLNFFMSGNRDADAFEKPEEFNVARQRNAANVAFGFGGHFCIGAAVARLEINILFEELINRFSHVQLVGSPDRDLKQLHFYAWENVQVIFS
jgi:cytochrome P450